MRFALVALLLSGLTCSRSSTPASSRAPADARGALTSNTLTIDVTP